MDRRIIKIRTDPSRDESLSAIKMTLIRFNALVQEQDRQNYYSLGKFTAGHRDFLYEMSGRQYLENMNAVLMEKQLEELDDEALETVLEKCRRLSDGFGLCVDIPKKAGGADERESARCWTVKKDRDGKTQSIVYGGGNDVLEIFPDGREEYHEYSGIGSRAGFLARYAGLPVLADGTSPLMLNALSENGYSYDEEKKLWIAGENAETEFDCQGDKKIPEPKDEIKKEIYKKYYTIYKKWSKLITGIEGNIIELDNRKGKIIATVPYYSQRDNATKDPPVEAYNMCQITSLAMVLKSKGIEQQYPDMQFEDELYKIAKENVYGGDALWEKTIKVYNTVVKKVSSNYTVKLDDNRYDINSVREQIDKENPVLMSINFKLGGHMVVVIGYTQNGFIVHDPYGNLNKGENNNYGLDTDGAYVEYPYDKWSIGNKWISFLLPKDYEK